MLINSMLNISYYIDIIIGISWLSKGKRKLLGYLFSLWLLFNLYYMDTFLHSLTLPNLSYCDDRPIPFLVAKLLYKR